MSATLPNPAGWPEELLPLFQQAITCECATLTRADGPITTPLTPYTGTGTLDVSTGLTYPTKAERVRRNPKVGLLFSDPVGTGLAHPPIALVTGFGAVRDADLQANTDRYVREALAKNPDSMKGMPKFLLTRLGWYFARIWIEVTPTRILWWPEGRTDTAPREWVAPDIVLPQSDPAPSGKAPAQWKAAPPDWRSLAAHAAANLGAPVLTTVDAEGFPIPIRVGSATVTATGFRFALPGGLPTPSWGKACLTFHSHPEVFTKQENRLFTGEVTQDDDGAAFRVERAVADWSLNGAALGVIWHFLGPSRKLAPRLRAEAARHGQPVPRVRL